MSLLQDKVIIVTGATTGIGAATIRRCAAEGARVVVHGLDDASAEAMGRELDAPWVAADLADPASASRVIATAEAAYGRLDGLVNNAALTTRSNLETADAAHFDEMVAVNLRAPLLLIQAALPLFRRAGGGAVVNVGSVNAYCGEPNLLVYSITKGGLMTMTRNLADRYGPERIRINQLNLGWTLTENERRVKAADGLPDGWEHDLPLSDAPFGRIFEPEEVARHVAFWLSDAAGPVSGSICEIEQHPMIGRNAHKGD